MARFEAHHDIEWELIMSKLALTPPSPSPSSRLGRSAWLVLGAALLSGGGLIAVGTFISGGTVDKEQIVWMGALIGGVFCVWAVVLALRALWRGERAMLPLGLLNLMALAAGALGVWMWARVPEVNGEFVWYLDTGLPLAIPFCAAASLSGTVVLSCALRWIERRRMRSGKPVLTQRERCWLLVKLGVPFLTLLALILLPVPIFLYLTARDFKMEPPALVKAAPNFVRDPAERVARTCMEWKWMEAWGHVEWRLLENQLVSNARLIERAGDPDVKLRIVAICALVEHEPKLAARFAVETIETAQPNSRGFDFVCFELAEIVAKRGSSDERCRLLRKALANSATELTLAQTSFFEKLAEQPRDDAVIPLLEQLAGSATLKRAANLKPLIEWLPEDEAIQLISAELDSGDHIRQRDTIIWLRPSRISLWKRKFFLQLDHPDINVRRLTLESRLSMLIPYSIDQTARIECVRKLLTILEQHDVCMKRGAARALCDLCWIGSTFHIQEVLCASSKTPIISGGTPCLETPEETADFKTIRAEAEKWLKQNEK